MRRVHRETVDVLARFGRDGRLEPCVVVLKDCRAFRIDEVLMASSFGPVRHGKRTARWSAHWPPDGAAALKTWGARGRGGTHCFRAALLGRTGVAPSGHGKICAPCMIRGSRTGKGGLRGKIFAQCIPRRLFAGLFGRMARESCQNQLISDAWRRYLAANRRFSRPRPLRERMRRKNCHG